VTTNPRRRGRRERYRTERLRFKAEVERQSAQTANLLPLRDDCGFLDEFQVITYGSDEQPPPVNVAPSAFEAAGRLGSASSRYYRGNSQKHGL